MHNTLMRKTKIYDIAIIGGGVNGCGIARDAAGRGLSVYLCEQHDLSAATSSASSKLIHGGLRYLEHFAFGLVRKALKERSVLLKNAPHIIKPIRFVLPHMPHLRPKILIRIGLFLYDSLAFHKGISNSKSINLRNHEAGKPLISTPTDAFMYSDCTVDDSRLVILNAFDARHKGAVIETHTKCEKITYAKGVWHIETTSATGSQTIKAKALVNATGPWASDFLKDHTQIGTPYALQLIKGSHIVVKKLFEHNHAYTFQHHDGRVIFTIPYQRDFTLIGTTDVNFHKNPDSAAISPEETNYLCDAVNQYFEKQILAKDVIWSYSGVRALIQGGQENISKISRDYKLELIDKTTPPLLNVWSGKITTYRTLAEESLHALKKYFPELGIDWTADAPLPGAHITNGCSKDYAADLQTVHPWLPSAVAERYASSYGSLTKIILAHKSELKDMGQHFGHGLYAAEVDYLCQYEWAKTIDDILWRRSKLGLLFGKGEELPLEKYIDTLKVEPVPDLGGHQL